MAGSRQYVFGAFRLDVRQRALFRHHELIALTPKSLETLLFLVERHGQIVDKKEILEAVWPETFVEEVSLARNVSLLRKALSDQQDGHAFIETIPKRGYRFVAAVEIEDLPSTQTELTAIAGSRTAEPGIPPRRRISSLRRKWVWTLAVVAICSGVLEWMYLRERPAQPHPLIIVLPVQNLTGDATREYVADGLTEELIARLGSLGSDKLSVIARTSAMSYKNSSKTVAQVGRELGVNYVIESSVRQWGDRVRITAQLIRVRDQSHLWVRDYDSSGQDLLTIEEEIARDVANEIEVRLTTTTGESSQGHSPHQARSLRSLSAGPLLLGQAGTCEFSKGDRIFSAGDSD